MVYPEEYMPSSEGSRAVIDDNDFAIPLVITLMRQGSSDHLQPNFPTPGQIRSMFNTDKINECPEYANSPTTMSDPSEWRPSNQLDMIEERLLRIQQWADNTFQSQTYEGNNCTISDLTGSNESSIDNFVLGSELDFNVEQTICNLSESIRVNLYNDDAENQSEVQYISSNDSLKTEDEIESNQREYDVEEYVEQLNSSDIMNSSLLNLTNRHYRNEREETVKSHEGIDRETFARIKQLEKIFRLNIKEEDNDFIKELKTMLSGKIRDYMTFRDHQNSCPLSEVIEDISDILNEAIDDNDAVICDNVHDLCLKLKDILTLKEEIMGNAMREYLDGEKSEDVRVESEINSDILTPVDSIYSDNSSKEVGVYDVNSSTEESKELSEKESSDERMKPSNDETSEIQSNENYTNNETDSFESLITFSRIPIANQSKIKCNNNNSEKSLKVTQSKNLKSQYVTKIPMYQPAMKSESQEKTPNESELTFDHAPDQKEELKSAPLCKEDHRGKGSKQLKQIKDVIQQKEALIKKATLLGLIDDERNISRVPHLTQRGRLALLERQIQGKLKSKQLALERKKTGLPERINSRLPGGNNASGKSNNPEFQKINRASISPAASNNSNVEKQDAHRQKKSNKTSNNTKPSLKTDKKSRMRSKECADNADEIISVIDLSDGSREDPKRTNPSLESTSIEDINIVSLKNENDSDIKIITDEKATDNSLFTAFMTSKEKRLCWENGNGPPSHSKERLQNMPKWSHKFVRSLFILSILILIFGIAVSHYRPEMFHDYLRIVNEWISAVQEIHWKEIAKEKIERINSMFQRSLIKI